MKPPIKASETDLFLLAQPALCLQQRFHVRGQCEVLCPELLQQLLQHAVLLLQGVLDEHKVLLGALRHDVLVRGGGGVLLGLGLLDLEGGAGPADLLVASDVLELVEAVLEVAGELFVWKDIESDVGIIETGIRFRSILIYYDSRSFPI